MIKNILKSLAALFIVASALMFGACSDDPDVSSSTDSGITPTTSLLEGIWLTTSISDNNGNVKSILNNYVKFNANGTFDQYEDDDDMFRHNLGTWTLSDNAIHFHSFYGESYEETFGCRCPDKNTMIWQYGQGDNAIYPNLERVETLPDYNIDASRLYGYWRIDSAAGYQGFNRLQTMTVNKGYLFKANGDMDYIIQRDDAEDEYYAYRYKWLMPDGISFTTTADSWNPDTILYITDIKMVTKCKRAVYYYSKSENVPQYDIVEDDTAPKYTANKKWMRRNEKRGNLK